MKALNCDHCFYANQLVVKLLRNLSTFQKSKTHFITNEDDCYFRAQLLFADRLFSASIIFPEVGYSVSLKLLRNLSTFQKSKTHFITLKMIVILEHNYYLQINCFQRVLYFLKLDIQLVSISFQIKLDRVSWI